MPKFINITKKWGNKSIFDKFSLELPDEKVSVILGESGVGKSTLLSVAASLTDYEGKTEGFENPSFVFQQPRLIEQLSVYENIEFALSSVDMGKGEKKRVIQSALEKARILPLAGRNCSSLSGGEKQRVSLARAIAFPSDVLLTDEPFNSLDIRLKSEIISDLKNVVSEQKRTVLFVTHSVDEAMFFGDYIVVLKNNKAIVLGEKPPEKTFGYEDNPLLRKTLIKILSE